MTPCLSEEDLLAFAIGRLPASRLASAHLHLDECQACQCLLNEAAHSLATATTIPLAEGEDIGWNTMFRPGMLVGQRYRIVQFIARGGMGEVYEAFDQDLHERVALKTVNSTASDSPRAAHLLKGEVQTARRVSHPNVCRIYDFGTHVMSKIGVQISFLTMEFVEGETLGQRIRLGGALPIPEAQKLARQLLHGLKAAHDAHVLHRDFKSDNVMLRNEAGDETSPLIMDFGLARAFDRESKHASSSSNSALVGTFSNIAPEQLEGKLHSKASDVYAFGVVWFEMLTGELPFESSSSPAVAVLDRVRRAAPAPSSKNPLVPRELDALVLGCLRRSPKERYRSAGEVLAALDTIETRAHSRANRQRRVPALLALGLGVVAGYWALRMPTKNSSRADVVSTFSSASPARPVAAAPLSTAKQPDPVASERSASALPVVKPGSAQSSSRSQKSGPQSAASAKAPPAKPPDTPVALGSGAPAWENPFPGADRVEQPEKTPGP
ncbi:MAG: serine/threonine-protein kinase [Pseudomonadota bacterium]